MMRMPVQFTNDPDLPERLRNLHAAAIDCRGNEDDGFEYLVESLEVPGLKRWVADYYLIF